MEINLPVDNKHCYKALLKILNFLTNMTDTELDVIAAMMSNKITVLTKEARIELLAILGKDKFTLNNHIKRLKEKKVLVEYDNDNKNKLHINGNLSNMVENSLSDGEIKLNLHVS